MPMADLDDYHTVADAARQIGISRRTAYRRVQSNHLRARLVMKYPKPELMVSTSEIERYRSLLAKGSTPDSRGSRRSRRRAA